MCNKPGLCVFMQERVHKIMAQAGIGSRRECERLIVEGSVTVNGQTVRDPGVKVDPADAAIKVKGKLLRPIHSGTRPCQYLILYKPKGVLTTTKSAEEDSRPVVVDLLPKNMKRRVFPVGRLDYHSEGLILFTDDGDLAYRLTHPKYELPKTYEVKVHGLPSPQLLRTLAHGVMLEDGKTLPASVRMFKTTGKNAWLKFTIYEGRKRQIRRMCEQVQLHVMKLKRIAIGPITLKGLKPGQFRMLLPGEVKKLKDVVQVAHDPSDRGHKKKQPQNKKHGGTKAAKRSRT